MSDDPLKELIRRNAESYNRPPETPRERIWARIQVERLSERRRRSWRHLIMFPRIWVPAAAAALLFIGIFIGRSWQKSPAPAFNTTNSEHRSESGTRVPSIFEVAALRHFSRVDLMLTRFNTETDKPAKDELVDWARPLLVETRLLIDSPAAESVEIKRLLNDLEFVLAQIVQIEQKQNGSEREWINEGLHQKNILARLRAAVPVRDIRQGI
ncbi:MAG: hypothetical protein KJ970_11565 [Candidatus Eisenbacteria bacterium]|uniref:DUF5667 domain-containing protein n=1 Tax=Eiseniibacteriota bacterium TaxID=2212470 RepID=A0A948W6W2_UNCEI|nr:hypothetical protein [Candidatus Eisenbacteria bacterium]MBU1948880.1 hypothetical protein [Candidatus Eisenbacteria bacterium]MBU2691555.1 hypothetical protein [Candidatus Eisenbacteria bacterium]